MSDMEDYIKGMQAMSKAMSKASEAMGKFKVLKKRHSRKEQFQAVYDPTCGPFRLDDGDNMANSDIIAPEWDEFLPDIEAYLKERWAGLKFYASSGNWKEAEPTLAFKGVGGFHLELVWTPSGCWMAFLYWDVLESKVLNSGYGTSLLNRTMSHDHWREALDEIFEKLPGPIENIASSAMDVYEGFLKSK